MKLTAKTIDALELSEGKSEWTFWDAEITGFGLRVRKSGKRTFVYYYRVGSQQHRMTLGDAARETVERARKTAADLSAKVHLGQDPALAKEIAKQEAGHSFGATVENFLAEFRSQWSERYVVEAERYLAELAKPLHALPLVRVTQRDISSLLNAIARERGDVSANRTRASLSKLYSWVLSEGTKLPEGNPVIHTRKREEERRDRVLNDDELRAIWNACRDDQYGAIVRLLMLTGQRREEIGALRYAEIRGNQIEYPKARTKNGQPHFVPLSDPALEIIHRFPANGREFVFGLNDAGFCGWVSPKGRLDTRSGVKGWTLHDLRRTVATRLAQDLGIMPHVIEAILNHVSGHKAGVAGIYNRATYPKERREALNLWAEHLTAIVEGRATKVVPLKRGA